MKRRKKAARESQQEQLEGMLEVLLNGTANQAGIQPHAAIAAGR
ncbi:MAG: hypothetical protein WA005_02545 [Candidatus Binataceae bacterium]